MFVLKVVACLADEKVTALEGNPREEENQEMCCGYGVIRVSASEENTSLFPTSYFIVSRVIKKKAQQMESKK